MPDDTGDPASDAPGDSDAAGDDAPVDGDPAGDGEPAPAGGGDRSPGSPPLHDDALGETPVHDQTRGDALMGGLVTRGLLVKTAAGFVVALVVLYVLGLSAGWGEIIAALAGADPFWVGMACLSTFLGLAAWGKAWQVVLGVAGVEESYRRLVVTYFAATFANYVTPLGQAGGEPFIAYVLSSDTDASYQDSLASVVTADLLNLLPFFNFAAIGLGWLLLKAGLPEDAETLAQGLGLMAVAIPVLMWAGWKRRDAVEAAVVAVVEPMTRHTDRFSADGVRHRIDEFYAALERIATDPRALGYALVFAYVGWVLFALPLYLGALALGYPIELVIILFVVPASTLAGLVPTPGGSGAVEFSVAVLLLALTALSRDQAAALALIYRFASYYFAIGVGGLSALWVIRRA